MVSTNKDKDKNLMDILKSLGLEESYEDVLHYVENTFFSETQEVI